MKKLKAQKGTSSTYNEKQCGFSLEDARIVEESFERAFRSKTNKIILKNFFVKTR